MTCPMCQGKCCRDVDYGYRVEHMAAEVCLHVCDCADGTWVNPDAQALDEVTAEARRLSTAVDRLERESLEVLAALGLHEDTEHAEVLAHVRALVKEHAEMRMVIEGHRHRFNKENPMSRQIPVPEMVYIPAPPGEEYVVMKTGHPCRVTAFSIGKYPVTQREWAAVMGTNPFHFKGDKLPVESVSWEEAVAFCEKLSDAHGLTGSDRYRLPTEAEWEWAASGGIREDRGVTDDTGWYYDNSGGQTHPVGEKKANGFGLHDTLGNVWEWTESECGSNRVIRGGCWLLDPRSERVANRFWLKPGHRDDGLGFRLARGGK